MKTFSFPAAAILIPALLLSSCSGVPKTGTTPPASGNSTVVVTFQDTPPANVSILSFTVTLSGLALNPSTGTAVNLALTPSPLSIELTRLQSDSFFGSVSASVPAGTYNSLSVAIASSKIVYTDTSGATCAVNTICTATPTSAATVNLTATPFPLTLISGQNAAVAVDFNLQNAITSAMGVDFTAAGAVKPILLPRTGTPTGAQDLVEDFAGTVSSFSSATNSLTVQSGTRGTLTGTVGTTTVYHDTLLTCAALDSTCLTTGRVVSVNAGVNPDGTLAIREVDLLDSTATDMLEGVIAQQPGSATSFSVILSEKVVATTSNTALTGAQVGNQINLSWSSAPTFVVDTAGMPLTSSYAANLGYFTGGTDSSVLVPGQTVMVSVTGATSPGSGVVNATATRVMLRQSRITAAVFGTPGTNLFNIDAASLAPFYLASTWGTTSPQVAVFSNLTSYDGVTGISSLAAGNIITIRALYIQNAPKSAAPMFFASKVRLH